MVCAKCQRLLKATELATPGVKRKSEIYYGSNSGVDKGKSGGASSGVAKVRLTSAMLLLRHLSALVHGHDRLIGECGWQIRASC